jgi:hypothetical protein
MTHREDEIRAELATLRTHQTRLEEKRLGYLKAADDVHAQHGDPEDMPETALWTWEQSRKAASETSIRLIRERRLIARREAELSLIRRPAKTADDFQAARQEGNHVDRDEILEALDRWQARADDLAKSAAKRTRQGKSPLASEADAMQKARANAYALSELLDHYEPVHRLDAMERFPHDC